MEKARRQFSVMGIAWLAFVAIASMLILSQSCGLLGGASPSIISPDMLMFLLFSLVQIPEIGLVLLAGAFVISWCYPLGFGEPSIPRRTVVLAFIVGISSMAWFLSAIIQGLSLGGPTYFSVVTFFSFGLLILTAVLIRRAKRNPSITSFALAHLVLFGWLFSYAYPWFGEVP